MSPSELFIVIISKTKLNGGLSRLHSADEDAVLWLTVMVDDTHTRKRRRLVVTA